MRRLLGWIILCVASGCAIAPRYVDLEKGTITQASRPEEIYDLAHWLAANQRLPSTAVVVTMSGGGTRAASLAYAVLQELQHRPMLCVDLRETCTMLDNVILVSGISGGAFTASAFARQGPALLGSPFQRELLSRDLKTDLTSILVEPRYWGDRTQKVVDLLNRVGQLNHATYRDLMHGPHPFLLLAGTDAGSGRSIPLMQDSFDDLCADIAKLELARAAAAAASLPYALNGISFDNYHASRDCDDATRLPLPRTLASELFAQAANANHDLAGSARARYRLWMRQARPDGWRQDPSDKIGLFESPPDRRIEYLHLFDGGLGDNLGIRPAVNLLSDAGTLQALSMRGVHNLVFIEVNARSESPDARARKRGEESFIELATLTTFGAVDRVTELSSYLADEHFNLTMSMLVQPDGGRLCEGYPCVYLVRIDADLLGGSPVADRDREAFKRMDVFTQIGEGERKVIERMASALMRDAPCMRHDWGRALDEDEANDLVRHDCRLYRANNALETGLVPYRLRIDPLRLGPIDLR